VAAINFICGIAIVTLAQSYTTLMVGRVFVGLGVGFGLAVSYSSVHEVLCKTCLLRRLTLLPIVVFAPHSWTHFTLQRSALLLAVVSW
jgi:MFS family permease